MTMTCRPNEQSADAFARLPVDGRSGALGAVVADSLTDRVRRISEIWFPQSTLQLGASDAPRSATPLDDCANRHQSTIDVRRSIGGPYRYRSNAVCSSTTSLNFSTQRTDAAKTEFTARLTHGGQFARSDCQSVGASVGRSTGNSPRRPHLKIEKSSHQSIN
eukprot:Selendium_serpulae@DN8654_c0_g1_i1.p1